MLSCCSQSLSARFGWLRPPCRPLQGLGSLRRQEQRGKAAVGLQWGRGGAASLPALCLCLLCWWTESLSLIGEMGGGLNWNLVPAGKVLVSAEQESYRDWGERLLKTVPVLKGRVLTPVSMQWVFALGCCLLGFEVPAWDVHEQYRHCPGASWWSCSSVFVSVRRGTVSTWSTSALMTFFKSFPKVWACTG